MLLIITNCPTSVGFPNFTKPLAKMHCWFQKNETSVSTPDNNTSYCKGEALDVLFHMPEVRLSNVNPQNLSRNTRKHKIFNFFSD
jgi:hypothetical protein